MKKIIYLVGLALMLLGTTVQAQSYATNPTARSAMVEWVQDNARIDLPMAKARKIVATVIDYATQRQLDPMLILSIMKVESGFITTARSGYGAQGLMQVVPRWHHDKLKGRSAYNPDVSIEVGTQVLGDCWEKFNGHVARSVNCYSGGGGQKYLRNVQATYKEASRFMVTAWFSKEEQIQNLPRVTSVAMVTPRDPEPAPTYRAPRLFVPNPVTSYEKLALMTSFQAH